MIQASKMLSAHIRERDFDKIVYEWMAEGDFTPDDLIEKSIWEKALVLIPIYIYNKSYDGNCSASLSYSNYQGGVVGINQYPYSQPVFGNHTIIGIACNYEKGGIFDRIQEQLFNNIPNLHNIISIHNKSLGNTEVGDFQYNSNELWLLKIKEIALEQIKNIVIKELPSQNIQNFNLNIRFQDNEIHSAYMPCWLLFYTYKNQKYQVYLDATGNYKFQGSKPVDRNREKTIEIINSIVVISYILEIIAIIYIYNITDGYGLLLVISACILLLITAIIGVKIIENIKKRSLTVRNVFLNTKLRKLGFI
jgi:hypothetical protein